MTQPPTLSEMRQALGNEEDVIHPPTLSEMQHTLETEDDVLAHFGIKGMKWGVRRSPAQLAGASVKIKNSDGSDAGSLEPTSKGAAKALKAMRPGETMVVDGEHGAVVLTKQTDGTLKKAHVSADAERFIETLNKTPDQMSDKELKAANNRAQQLQSYNKLFGVENKSALEQQVEALALQKKYRDLQNELNPPKKSAVNHLIAGSVTGFNAYKQVDNLLKGEMTNALSSKLGLKPPMSPLDMLKLDNDLTNLRTANIKARAEFNDTMALDGRRARGDLPSQAKDYTGTGKRRAALPDEGKRRKNDGYSYRLPG